RRRLRGLERRLRDVGRGPAQAARARGLRGAPRRATREPALREAGRGVGREAAGEGVAPLQQLSLADRTAARLAPPEVSERARGRDASARRAVEEALLDQEGLVDVLDRALVLAHARRERLEADRTARVLVDQGQQELAVHAVEAGRVDAETLERTRRERGRDR